MTPQLQLAPPGWLFIHSSSLGKDDVADGTASIASLGSCMSTLSFHVPSG